MIKKMVLPQKRLQFLRIRDQSWIRDQDFLDQIRYFIVNGYFESEEKISGLPTNPEKFGLV